MKGTLALLALAMTYSGAGAAAQQGEWQYHGSIYGVVPAKRGALKRAGEWNQEEIRAEGSRIRVTVNGTVVVDADIREAGLPRTVDGREHPGLFNSSGYIGFLGHGDRVEFRDIRIMELR
jgi:outer membrane protein W